ncbi:transporter [Pandoraea terrae]|uniref:Transporter n=1 Tax=Pandoraea terrae TaxID=1537710 RepID=A0A5E4V2U2_9BURK|nr:transporter [Pandoraea terrae]VVE06441.1 transporter [Pandoraea terrae]
MPSVPHGTHSAQRARHARTGPRILMSILAASTLLAFHSALATPPFVTDDAEPAENGHFEINVGATGTVRRDEHSGALPAAEINYGATDNLELNAKVGMSFMHPSGEKSHYGFGDTELGIKYRFITEDDEGIRPQVAFGPSVTLPTGNDHLGLGDGHSHVSLPLWVQKSFGDWTTYGGGGYVVNRHANERGYWFGGWALTRKINEHLELGGEVFYTGAATVADPSSLAFNLGGKYSFTEHDRLLFSAGRGITHVNATNQFSYYLGYQRDL